MKDDLPASDTKLDLLFARSSNIPAKTKKTVEVSKTIIHGSDDKIRIIVVEGPSENHFTVNKTVGYLAISGKDLKRDLPHKTEIVLEFDLSESRDLWVHASIKSTGQEFSQIYHLTLRDVKVDSLRTHVQALDAHLEREKNEALENENCEVVDELLKLRAPVRELQGKVMLLDSNDVTDDRYKLEDKMRELAQKIYQLTSGKRIERLRNEYLSVKEEAEGIVYESGNDVERRQLDEIIAQEHAFLNSTNPQRIEEKIAKLHHVSFQILRRTPSFLTDWFQHLVLRKLSFLLS